MDLVKNLLIKIKKLSMDLVHDRGSMDPVHVLSSPNTCNVKRQQQDTTVTLQTKPTKRGNTDCPHFSKMWSTEFTTKPKRGKFTVKIIFFDATGSKNYTICKIKTRSIFPTD